MNEFLLLIVELALVAGAMLLATAACRLIERRKAVVPPAPELPADPRIAVAQLERGVLERWAITTVSAALWELEGQPVFGPDVVTRAERVAQTVREIFDRCSGNRAEEYWCLKACEQKQVYVAVIGWVVELARVKRLDVTA